MNTKRLEKLAEHLSTIPKRGFDMFCWSKLVDEEPLKPKHHKNEYKCGMAACIGGHATLVFPRLLELKTDINDEYATPFLVTKKGDEEESHAFAKVFDLCNKCSSEITAGCADHTTPKKAAKVLYNQIKGSKQTWGKPNIKRCKFGIYNCHTGMS